MDFGAPSVIMKDAFAPAAGNAPPQIIPKFTRPGIPAMPSASPDLTPLPETESNRDARLAAEARSISIVGDVGSPRGLQHLADIDKAQSDRVNGVVMDAANVFRDADVAHRSESKDVEPTSLGMVYPHMRPGIVDNPKLAAAVGQLQINPTDSTPLTGLTLDERAKVHRAFYDSLTDYEAKRISYHIGNGTADQYPPAQALLEKQAAEQVQANPQGITQAALTQLGQPLAQEGHRMMEGPFQPRTPIELAGNLAYNTFAPKTVAQKQELQAQRALDAVRNKEHSVVAPVAGFLGRMATPTSVAGMAATGLFVNPLTEGVGAGIAAQLAESGMAPTATQAIGQAVEGVLNSAGHGAGYAAPMTAQQLQEGVTPTPAANAAYGAAGGVGGGVLGKAMGAMASRLPVPMQGVARLIGGASGGGLTNLALAYAQATAEGRQLTGDEIKVALATGAAPGFAGELGHVLAPGEKPVESPPQIILKQEPPNAQTLYDRPGQAGAENAAQVSPDRSRQNLQFTQGEESRPPAPQPETQGQVAPQIIPKEPTLSEAVAERGRIADKAKALADQFLQTPEPLRGTIETGEPAIPNEPPAIIAKPDVAPDFTKETPRVQAEPAKPAVSSPAPATPEEVSAGPEKGVGGAGYNSPEFSDTPAEQDRTETGIKNSISEEDRTRLGLPPLESPQSKDFETVYSAGKSRIESDPGAVEKLLGELRTNTNRPLSDEEVGVLLKHKVDLEKESQRINKDIGDAYAKGDTEAEEAARQEMAAHRARVLDFTTLAKQGGTASARGLNARRMISAMDYSLSHMAMDAEAAKGSPLTNEESDAVAAIHSDMQKRLADIDTADEEYTKQLADQRADEQVENLKSQVLMQASAPMEPHIRSLADRIIARLDKASDAAEARLRSRGIRVMAGLDPETIKDMTVIGSAQIAKGLVKFADWSAAMVKKLGDEIKPHLQDIYDKSGKFLDTSIDRLAGTKSEKAKGVIKPPAPVDLIAKMKERMADGDKPEDLQGYIRKLAFDLVRSGINTREPLLDALHAEVKKAIPDITRKQTRDILSGYGDFRPLDKSADKVALRDIQQQSQKLAQLESLEKGVAPLATGFERPSPSNEVRTLQKRVNEAKRKAGIVSTDPEKQLKSTLESLKTRTRNTITDLQAEIDTGQRIIAGKTTPITDAELEALRIQLKAVRELHAEAFEKPGLSDEDRTELATKAAKKNFEAWSERLDKARRGVFDSPAAKRVVTNPELEALRARTAEAKQEFNELEKLANPPQTASEKTEKALARQIKKLDEKIRTGKVESVGPKQGPDPAGVAALKSQRDALSSKLAEMRKAQSPRNDPVANQLEKAIQKLNERMASGQLEPTPSARQGPDTAYVASLKSQRDAITSKLQELRDNDPVIQSRKAAESAEKSAAEYERKAAAGEFVTKDKPTPMETARLKDAQLAREQAKNKYAELRDKDAGYLQAKNDQQNEAYRTSLAKREADLKDRMAKEDYSKRPVNKLELNAKSLKAKAAYEKVRQEYEGKNEAFRLKNRSTPEKIADGFSTWIRAGALSWPSVIKRLTGAAASRTITTPLEQVTGYGIGKLYPQLTALAPREGVPSASGAAKAEGKALAATFTQGVKDFGTHLLNRKTDLDLLHGSHKVPPNWKDYLGSLHAAFKAPAFANEYARALELVTQHAVSNGEDVTNPETQLELSNKAYMSANRAILQQSGKLTDGIKSMLQTWERPDPKTGKVNPAGKALATAFRTEFPITKVPINFAGEVLNILTGSVVGPARAAFAHMKGLDNLTPEQADNIVRAMKKGFTGLPFLLMGFYAAANGGGFYQKGQKAKEGDVKAGDIRVGDTDIDKGWLHSQYADIFQYGATLFKAAASRLSRTDPDPRGFGSGLLAASMGLLGQIPYIRETSTVANLMDPQTQDNAFQRKLASILVPGVFQWAAQQADKDASGNVVKRKPESLGQNIEMGIPGMRQNVKVAEAAPPLSAKVLADKAKAGDEFAYGMEHLPFAQLPGKWEKMSDEQKKKYGPAIETRVRKSDMNYDVKQAILKRLGFD